MKKFFILYCFTLGFGHTVLAADREIEQQEFIKKRNIKIAVRLLSDLAAQENPTPKEVKLVQDLIRALHPERPEATENMTTKK